MSINYTENLCIGGVATASESGYSSSPANAFDGSTVASASTGWYVQAWNDSRPLWIQYQFPKEQRIRKLRLYSYGYSGHEAVTNFTLQASNTGSFSGEESNILTSNHAQGAAFVDYEFDSGGNFLYYRLKVNTVHPDGSLDPVIQEIEMMAEKASHIYGNLFLNGENNRIKDLGINKHSVSVESGVAPSTDQFKWGSYGIHNSVGYSKSIRLPAHADWGFGLEPFTIDTWIYLDAYETYDTFFEVWNGVDNQRGFMLYYRNDTSTLYFTTSRDGTDAAVNSLTQTGLTFNLNTWYHVAVTRDVTGTLRFFIDGVKTKEAAYNYTIHSATAGLQVGRINGYLDNVRIVSDESLWSNNFSLIREDLFYPYVANPDRADKLRTLYNLSAIKGNLRGKAKDGLIRPTIMEFFTSADYKVLKILGYSSDKTDPTTALTAATASASVNTGWLAPKAFDDQNGTSYGWHSGAQGYPINQWIKYDFGEPTRINKITLTPLSADGYLPYICRDFTLEGSNNDSSWDILGTYTDNLWDVVESKEFLTNNSEFYRYYRIVVTRTGNDTTNSSVVIGEIEMMEGVFE